MRTPNIAEWHLGCELEHYWLDIVCLTSTGTKGFGTKVWQMGLWICPFLEYPMVLGAEGMLSDLCPTHGLTDCNIWSEAVDTWVKRAPCWPHDRFRWKSPWDAKGSGHCLGWHTSLMIRGGLAQCLWTGKPGWWFPFSKRGTGEWAPVVRVLHLFQERRSVVETWTQKQQSRFCPGCRTLVGHLEG